MRRFLVLSIIALFAIQTTSSAQIEKINLAGRHTIFFCLLLDIFEYHKRMSNMKSPQKLFILLFLPLICLIAQNKTNNPIVEKYLPKLNRIIEFYGMIKQIHPVLERVYPIAIAEEGQFFIFEPDTNNIYRFVKQTAITSPVPKGIRAAFPLQDNDNKMTCVVTGEVFDSLDGYAIIFHEFVHCAEFATVELKLKNNLEIYKQAMEKGDWMWELNYPFPYTKKEFTEAYASLLSAMMQNDLEAACEIQKNLRLLLSKEEYSYMSWVEWKEGFARWVENKVRNKFGIKENHTSRIEPYDRVIFYEGGAQLIELIFNSNPQVVQDLEKLYESIKQ